MLKFPNHSPEAVRLALDEFSNTGRTRTKTLGGNTPWTEEEYQRFKNHKTGYFRMFLAVTAEEEGLMGTEAPDEVLMRAFPNHADNVKSIRQRLRSWRAKDRAEKMVVAERKVEEVGKKKRGRPRSKPMPNTEPSR